MINEKLNMKGELRLVLSSPNSADQIVEVKNLVVSTGLAFIASRMKDTASAEMSHMAIGAGTTPAAAADAALESELARVVLSSSTLVTTNVTDDAIQYVASFVPGIGTGAVTEAGILNDPTVGSLLCRTVFPVINKGAADTLTITWKVTIEA
jgi:hypothetical protein